MIYRTHIKIIADILNSAYTCEGITITNIVRQANISYTRLKHILNILLERGLLKIEEIDGSNRYIISDKGREFLNAYSRFYELAESFGLKM